MPPGEAERQMSNQQNSRQNALPTGGVRCGSAPLALAFPLAILACVLVKIEALSCASVLCEAEPGTDKGAADMPCSAPEEDAPPIKKGPGFAASPILAETWNEMLANELLRERATLVAHWDPQRDLVPRWP